jgi:hypothetical protein
MLYRGAFCLCQGYLALPQWGLWIAESLGANARDPHVRHEIWAGVESSFADVKPSRKSTSCYLCRSRRCSMPVYVCMRFDVCASAPFDACRLRSQAMRFDVWSKPCEGSEESSIWGISNADPRLYTKRKSPEISYTLNPFFTTDSRSPRCFCPHPLLVRYTPLFIRDIISCLSTMLFFSWKSARSSIVASSVCEAELMAFASCACEGVYARK